MDFACAGTGSAGGVAKAGPPRRRREHILAHQCIGAAYRHPVLISSAAVGDDVAAANQGCAIEQSGAGPDLGGGIIPRTTIDGGLKVGSDLNLEASERACSVITLSRKICLRISW